MKNKRSTYLSACFTRLRFPPLSLGQAFLVLDVGVFEPRGARLAGVATRELGTEKSALPPLALMEARIFTRRSEIARGVGWSISWAIDDGEGVSEIWI